MHSIIRCYAEIDIETFDYEKVHTDTSGEQVGAYLIVLSIKITLKIQIIQTF